MWQKGKLLVFSNFSFCHNVFKSRLLQMRLQVGKGFKLPGSVPLCQLIKQFILRHNIYIYISTTFFAIFHFISFERWTNLIIQECKKETNVSPVNMWVNDSVTSRQRSSGPYVSPYRGRRRKNTKIILGDWPLPRTALFEQDSK